MTHPAWWLLWQHKEFNKSLVLRDQEQGEVSGEWRSNCLVFVIRWVYYRNFDLVVNCSLKYCLSWENNIPETIGYVYSSRFMSVCNIIAGAISVPSSEGAERRWMYGTLHLAMVTLKAISGPVSSLLWKFTITVLGTWYLPSSGESTTTLGNEKCSL